MPPFSIGFSPSPVKELKALFLHYQFAYEVGFFPKFIEAEIFSSSSALVPLRGGHCSSGIVTTLNANKCLIRWTPPPFRTTCSVSSHSCFGRLMGRFPGISVSIPIFRTVLPLARRIWPCHRRLASRNWSRTKSLTYHTVADMVQMRKAAIQRCIFVSITLDQSQEGDIFCQTL